MTAPPVSGTWAAQVDIDEALNVLRVRSPGPWPGTANTPAVCGPRGATASATSTWSKQPTPPNSPNAWKMPPGPHRMHRPGYRVREG